MNASLTIAAVLQRLAGVFRRDTSGATAIEYSLIAALISVAILVSVFILGGTVSNMWNLITNEVAAGVAE